MRGTLDMTPSSAMHNGLNCKKVHAVLFSHIGLLLALSNAIAYFNHLVSGEWRFRGVVVRAASAFGIHVCNVVLIRSKPKMRGIDASRSVAVVANAHAVRDGAEVKFPRQAMSHEPLTVRFHRAVTVFDHVAAPQPTLVWRSGRYSFPKENVQGLCFSGLYGLEDMAVKKAHRFALDGAALGARLLGYVGLLSTAAMTVTVGNVVRGIMGMHKKFTFLVPSLGTIPVVAGAIRVLFTPSIIAQKGI